MLSTMIGYSIRIHEVKKVLTFIMGTNNPMLIKEKVIISSHGFFISTHTFLISCYSTYLTHFNSRLFLFSHFILTIYLKF